MLFNAQSKFFNEATKFIIRVFIFLIYSKQKGPAAQHPRPFCKSLYVLPFGQMSFNFSPLPRAQSARGKG